MAPRSALRPPPTTLESQSFSLGVTQIIPLRKSSSPTRTKSCNMPPPFRIACSGAARAISRRNCHTFTFNQSTKTSVVISQRLGQDASKTQLPRNSTSSSISIATKTSHSVRIFSTTSALSKKKGKDKSSNAATESASAGGAAGGEDPFDFSQLSNGIQDAVSRLKEDMSKLRVGGRLNPELIENVRVSLKSDSKHRETVKLSELAQVIPKGGRTITILIGEEDVCFLLLPLYSPFIDSSYSFWFSRGLIVQ